MNALEKLAASAPPPKYGILWHGGPSYSFPEPDYNELEFFSSLADMKADFESRLHDPFYPCVSRDTPDKGGPSAWVFVNPEPGSDLSCLDEVMEFDKRGRVVLSLA